MWYLAIAASNISAMVEHDSSEYFEVHADLPVYVICHESEHMCTPEVVYRMINIWKDRFHSSELPLTAARYPDIPEAFMKWLERQDYGYVVPRTAFHLVTMPLEGLQPVRVVVE